MIEVWQAEWCPHSARVRALLTDLQIDAVIHQVPEQRSDRDVMRRAVGTDEIPVIVLSDGTVLAGEADEIIGRLRHRFNGLDARGGPGPPAAGPSQPTGAEDPRAVPPRSAAPPASVEAPDSPLGVPASGAEAELPGFPRREPPSDG